MHLPDTFKAKRFMMLPDDKGCKTSPSPSLSLSLSLSCSVSPSPRRFSGKCRWLTFVCNAIVSMGGLQESWPEGLGCEWREDSFCPMWFGDLQQGVVVMICPLFTMSYPSQHCCLQGILLLRDVQASLCFHWFLFCGWVFSKIFFTWLWFFFVPRCWFGWVISCLSCAVKILKQVFQTNLRCSVVSYKMVQESAAHI